MIYWYQNLYMDETVEKNPKRCKKRVEKRRPWKKSYVVLTLAQNDKNLFEIMQTRQLFFHRYRHVDMYVVALTSDYDAQMDFHYTWHTFRTCFTIYGSCFMCAGALPGSRG